MEQLGIMGDIRIVAPDNASIEKSIKEFIPALMEDAGVMSKIGSSRVFTVMEDIIRA